MPGGTTSSNLYFVYVLESLKDGQRYIGFSTCLRTRLQEHEAGETRSTKHRRPLKVIYFEGCININDAKRREKYLKTTYDRRFLAKRLKEYYASH